MNEGKSRRRRKERRRKKIECVQCVGVFVCLKSKTSLVMYVLRCWLIDSLQILSKIQGSVRSWERQPGSDKA